MLSTVDVNKFKTLIEINERINSEYSDVTSLLTHILESATKLCEGEASSLLLVNSDTNTLYFEIALGSKGAEVSNYSLNMGEGIAGWVAEHNTSLLINDVQNDSRFSSFISTSVGFPTHTMIAVPMRIKERCVGVIEILNKSKNKFFTQEDLDWLEIFANQGALAIQNARKFQKIKNRLIFLEQEKDSDKDWHTFIAKSPLLLETVSLARKIAQTDSCVLISGESGTGKELFAELIHRESPRARKPFIRVNCAAIPETLLESELFGHVKGAFTDAIKNRIGRFELANEGTIFLDEIGEIPLSIQVKLLRVIQEKRFERLGSSETIHVDTRIIAATNRDLTGLIEKGMFRQDLFYRLNVFPIAVPALRDRRDDILALSDYFIKKFSAETKKFFSGFSDDAILAMLAYHWPGNVRELENVIERACVIGEGGIITSELLLIERNHHTPSSKIKKHDTLKNALTSFKKHFIQTVLQDCRGNQTEAAEQLGIQRTYLSRLIKELDI